MLNESLAPLQLLGVGPHLGSQSLQRLFVFPPADSPKLRGSAPALERTVRTSLWIVVMKSQLALLQVLSTSLEFGPIWTIVSILGLIILKICFPKESGSFTG